MLVLSRRVGEAIQIGENIVVTVNRVKGGTVSIGIEAPTEVRITRTDPDPERREVLQECQRVRRQQHLRPRRV